MKAFSRHLRSYQPSVIRSVPWWSYPVVAAVVFFAVGASATPTGAFVASPSSQQAVSTKGFNPLAGGEQ